jgi:hypothetical protein
MVRSRFIPCFRAAVRRAWTALLRFSALADRFPPEPPPSTAYGFNSGVAWNLTSVTQGGAFDPADPIQAMLAEDRRRFLSGALFQPLAALPERHVVVAAHIVETGAIRADHMLVLSPHGSGAPTLFGGPRRSLPVSDHAAAQVPQAPERGALSRFDRSRRVAAARKNKHAQAA